MCCCFFISFLASDAACRLSQLVDVNMNVHTTPAPVSPFSVNTPTPLTEVVTRIVMKGMDMDHGDFAALIGGIVSAVLLILICIIAFLLWCMSRQKGSYVTNETDDYDDDPDNNDDESVTSETTFQTMERLKAKEDE